jgi:hypothetical protein
MSKRMYLGTASVVVHPTQTEHMKSKGWSETPPKTRPYKKAVKVANTKPEEKVHGEA